MDKSFHEMLKECNLSVTSTRLAILDAVYKNPHTDADIILQHAKERSGSLSKQAVYDNLHLLTEKGILRAIQPKGHSTLYEPNTCDNHHHLVCRSCGKTVDVHCKTQIAPCLDPDHEHNFHIDEAEVIFWGFCPDCQTKTNDEGEILNGR